MATPRLREDFASAAVRHWGDAQALAGQNRLAGADHHTGIAAECAVKQALVVSGVAVPLPKTPNNYRQHIDGLWNVALTGIDAARFPNLCCLLGGAGNPFAAAAWQIDDRYAETGALQADITAQENGKPRWKQRLDTTGKLLQCAGLVP